MRGVIRAKRFLISCVSLVLRQSVTLSSLAATAPRGGCTRGRPGSHRETFTSCVGRTSAKCSLRPLLLALPDPERRTRRPWAGAAQKVRPQSRNAVTRTLCTRLKSSSPVRRASTWTDGHLMMGCGRARRAAAWERLQHSRVIQSASHCVESGSARSTMTKVPSCSRALHVLR